MTRITEIETQRLLLRQWKKPDWGAFAVINSSADVMEYFPNPLTRPDSDKLANRLKASIAYNGWGLWAVEVVGVCDFIGFVGLQELSDCVPSYPGMEIGWRLSDAYWGHGYATEAAQQVLCFGFNYLQLSNIYSYTSVINQKSINVMQRLKMENTHNNFNHAKLPESSPLRQHCLYQLSKDTWLDSL